MKKLLLLVLTLLLALSAFACESQNSGENGTKTPSAGQTTPTAAAVPTDTPALTESVTPTETATPTVESPTPTVAPTEAPTPELTTTPEPTPTYYVEPPLDDDRPTTVGCHPITLSGNRDNHTVTDRLCYYEGDKCFIFFDTDLDLPGDFCKNVELIIDALEQETGMSFLNCSEKPIGVDCCTIRYGYNPWGDISVGKKVGIYVFADKKDEALLSCAFESTCEFYSYDLLSEEIWNSVDSYRTADWRRHSFCAYGTLVHELTHCLTMRYATYTDIILEGCADYYEEKVLTALADKSEDFASSLECLYLSSQVQDKVTPENAEAIFLNDYRDLSHADRGDEYTLGRMICLFLEETYGKSFMRDYADALTAAGFPMRTGFSFVTMDDAAIQKQAEVFKSLFGDDAFTRFGAWYQDHR